MTALGATVLSGIALAACGSSDDGSTSTSASASDTQAAAPASDLRCGSGGGKATGSPIALGGFVTATGGPSLTQVTDTARAYFDCVNATGGINGHPVKYTVVDDGLNPQKTVQAASQLVDDEKVVAVAGSGAYLECPIASQAYAKTKVLAVEAVGGSPVCFTSPNISSTTLSSAEGTVANAQYLVDQGAKSIAYIGTSSAGIGPASAKAVQRYLDTTDAKLVKSVFYPPSIKDATSVVLDATQSHPDAVIVDGLEQDLVTLFGAARAQGLTDTSKWACGYPCYTPTFPKSIGSSWSGKVISTVPFAEFASGGPDAKQWNAVLDKYAPSVKRDVFSESGFLAAKIVSDALATIEGPITRESATQALKNVKGYKSDLLCSPWYWASDLPYHQPNHSFITVQIDGDGWKQVGDCTPIQDPSLKAVETAEQQRGLLK